VRHTLSASFFGLVSLFLMASIAVFADPVDDYILHQMRLQHIPGLSLAVVKDGKLVKAKGYGFANLELRVPATPETVYQLASVTKQFTATAIMLLVQDGKLRLDDKISQYLDGTPDTWKEITVRRLLTHTSGIPDYLTDEAVRSVQNTTPEKIMQSVAGLPMDFIPGAKYAYSNINFVLVASIVQKVSGKTYDAFLTERVFQPLGMTSTRRTSPSDLVPHRAAGYSWRNDTWQNSAYLDPTLWDNGDGGILSTVLDLAKWDVALNGDAILTAASKQQMWTPVRLNDGKTYSYGFGWSIDEFQGHRRIEHNGDRPGASITLSRYVDDKLTVIVLADVDNITMLDIADRVAGSYVPALSPAAYKPIPDTEPQVTARVKAIMDSFAQDRVDANLQSLDISTVLNFVKGILATGNGWQALSDTIHILGPVRSLALVERKNEGEERFYRYRATYPKDRLLLSYWLNKDNKIVRIGFQIEWP
jgi:D-alanyl-D-alanine carboxypeptidase